MECLFSGSIINNYKKKKKKDYFAVALDFLLRDCCIVKINKIIRIHRDFFQVGSETVLLSSTTGKSRNQQ